jgi:hypothetical protein
MPPSIVVGAIFAHFPINFNVRLPQEIKPWTPDGKMPHFKTILSLNHTFE